VDKLISAAPTDIDKAKDKISAAIPPNKITVAIRGRVRSFVPAAAFTFNEEDIF